MKFGYSILIILFFLNTYSFCSNLTYKEVTELHNKLHITKQKPYNFSYAEYDKYMLNLGDYQVTLLNQNALTINQWNSGTFDQCLDEVCRFTNELPNTDRNFAQTVRNLKTTFEERKSNSYPRMLQ